MNKYIQTTLFIFYLNVIDLNLLHIKKTGDCLLFIR